MSESQESPRDVEALTPEEANRIIHSHRKVRYGTACWPCRQRKVKCDNKSPCENCIKREHPQLCSYKPNRSAAGKASAGPESSQSKKRPHSPDNQDSRGSHDHSDEAQDNIRTYEPEAADASRYLGHNSIPAIIREQTGASSNDPRLDGVETIRSDMRSILGLDNTAPFPLMSSHHLDKMTTDIASELPSDREVMKLFRTYKEIPQTFWGFVIDIDDLESRLMVYLEERAKNAGSTIRMKSPVSASWLAILFAVLAVGSQYHDSPYHVRTRDSQKHIQISFHFLRLGNFLTRPNFDSIQALLMTSFVLVNDMKAEASWALLGLTCRLAQSLGLFRGQVLDGRESPDFYNKEMVRRRLWWTCVWHDTLTSLSFDRPSMTNIPGTPIPMSPTASTKGWAYLEAMYHLCQIISRQLNPDAIANVSYETILSNCAAVEMIRGKLLPQLRTKEACKSVVDRLQHFAIRLHTCFVVSVCCRPALHRKVSQLEPGQTMLLLQKCKENLTETVRMFLSMHQLSVIPTRSWAFTYHGLSSAVLLGIMTETKDDPEVRQLQGDLIFALSATAAKDLTSPQPHIVRSDRDIELSGPLSRALTALRNIYDHGSVIGSGVKGESSHPESGARTPLNLHGQLSGTGSPATMALNHLRAGTGTATPLDPHQNAALAMAEMQQNGAGLQDFQNMPFPSSTMQQPGVSDVSALDPATYMSPLDLYDSIFWEAPDPFNTGVDSMQFDFMAQPPPGQSQQQFYF